MLFFILVCVLLFIAFGALGALVSPLLFVLCAVVLLAFFFGRVRF